MSDEARIGVDGCLQNQAFRDYAGIYEKIDHHFLDQVSHSGLPLEAEGDKLSPQEARRRLAPAGAVVRNEGKSVYANRISPACLVCRNGCRIV